MSKAIMVTELELAIAKIPRIYGKQEWSRPEWIVIWQKITSYPDNPTAQERQDMDAWIRVNSALLPCKMCQEHFAAHINSNRYAKALESRTKLFLFFFHVHNDINARTGRPVMSPLEQVNVVSKLINWPRMWVMPTPLSEGSILSSTNAPASSVPWWSLLILGVVALGLGTALGVIVPRKNATDNE